MTRALTVVLLAICVVVAACSDSGSSAATSARTSPSTSPLAKASGAFDAEVPMPPNFPPDVPIYTGARLTAGASCTSTGQVAWGMEWETLDPVAKVQVFYAKQLSQGDWTITVKDSPSGTFSAVFSRRSNSKFAGTLAANVDGGVTKILMSLVSPR
jgi:hypothetical protein